MVTQFNENVQSRFLNLIKFCNLKTCDNLFQSYKRRVIKKVMNTIENGLNDFVT